MYDDDFYIQHTSKEIADSFQLTHDTIKKWIKKAIKNYPQLEHSFSKGIENKQEIYIIDEAGYDYLCNLNHGIKPASHEYFFKECLIPFLNELGYEVEYQKTILNYRVDFYIPDLNMVIEYDEEYHQRTKVSVYDKKREHEIVNATGVLFLRVPAKYDTIKALAFIAKVIIEKRLKIENKGV